ncbi:hypothetical protein [Candidatus Dactylopiibacterium carminicum]|uniref:hypothetical protein n=1 Tax=Candidatus Dactylopiibacterium carminicum TaxID=857335 RepID=UPI001140D81B|nr:hypothetical protein [Candidatus Dactylopiibacterium carminicum]
MRIISCFFLRKTYEFCEKIGSDFNLRKNFSEKEYVPMWTMSASVFLLESIGLMFDAGGRFDRDCLLSGEIVGRSLVLNHLLDGMPLSTINIIEELGVNLIR